MLVNSALRGMKAVCMQHDAGVQKTSCKMDLNIQKERKHSMEKYRTEGDGDDDGDGDYDDRLCVSRLSSYFPLHVLK